MSSLPVDPQSAGLLAAWLAAAIAGRATAAGAVTAIEATSDGHVVRGPHGTPEGASSEHSIADALRQWVDARPRSVRVAFPAPGDPLGLYGVGAFTSSAIVAQCAVVMDGGTRLGLVPEPDLRGSSYRGVRWQLFELGAPAPPGAALSPLTVEQADRALRRALRDATGTLQEVDLARWRPEVSSGGTAAAAALRTRLRALPPSWPAPARALAERSIALWHALEVVREDDGAATMSAGAVRLAAVRELSHAVREAAMVAFNVPASALLAGLT
jgi:hypothetical protein